MPKLSKRSKAGGSMPSLADVRRTTKKSRRPIRRTTLGSYIGLSDVRVPVSAAFQTPAPQGTGNGTAWVVGGLLLAAGALALSRRR